MAACPVAAHRGAERGVAAQVAQHPEVFVTWGSTFPDKIKFRKLVRLWPLRLKLRADYCRVSRTFEYGCSCKARGPCAQTSPTQRPLTPAELRGSSANVLLLHRSCSPRSTAARTAHSWHP
jgi:hypothetical protein